MSDGRTRRINSICPCYFVISVMVVGTRTHGCQLSLSEDISTLETIDFIENVKTFELSKKIINNTGTKFIEMFNKYSNCLFKPLAVGGALHVTVNPEKCRLKIAVPRS